MFKDISRVIRESRLAKHLTIEQLTEKAGSSVGAISRLENSESPNVGIKTLDKIATALGLPISIFFEDFKFSDKETNELISELKTMDDERRAEISKAILILLKNRNGSIFH